MKISTHHPPSYIDEWRVSSCLIAMPLIGTGQQKIQEGGKQNGKIHFYAA